jgi:glycerol-3-phosphate acyltransferase PlsY
MVVATWGLAVYLFRISSLGALVAAIAAPFYTAWILNMEYAMVVGVMSVFLCWRHLANIQRLLKGKEPTIGKKSSIPS